MKARYAAVGAVALLLTCWLAGSASASDDDPRPLYVVQDGRRIPTVIVPPAGGPGNENRYALLEVIEIEPGDLTGPPPAQDDEELAPQAGQDESDRLAAPPRWSESGYFAGYPISICHPSGVPWWAYDPYLRPGYRRALEDAYRAQRYMAERERGRRFNERDMRRRQQRILSGHEKSLREGLEHLKRAEYARAVVALTLAGELNQGDPACRIHLAQARLALRHYSEAGAVLRRALQLQPKLMYVSLNLPAYYGEPAEFDRHVEELAAWVRKNPADADTYFLLGFLEFQRERLEQAHAAFRVAIRGFPKDSLTQKYLEITRPPARR